MPLHQPEPSSHERQSTPLHQPESSSHERQSTPLHQPEPSSYERQSTPLHQPEPSMLPEPELSVWKSTKMLLWILVNINKKDTLIKNEMIGSSLSYVGCQPGACKVKIYKS
ncbi:hypothetical protein [Peribacillus simplex]|uniref:hypothetical protein n=1 Tax=Peribacillus simplex TaxID=1478 RepID=UPI0011A2F34D|nr:hypothetical protein [Peribacillus simplex]